MNPLDFLKYPEYFSIFMIWASGYIFTYNIFHESRMWRDFDSTIKFILALIMGFAIELGIILPLFYFLGNTDVQFFLPAFDKTWMYHWLITGAVSIFFASFKNKELIYRTINFIFFPVLFFVFFLQFWWSSILLAEYSWYYQIIRPLLYYLSLNFLFSIFGIIVSVYFNLFFSAAYETMVPYKRERHAFIRRKESKWNRTFFLWKVDIKTRYERFKKSRKSLVILPLIMVILGSIFPLDSYSHVFTPKIIHYLNPTCFETSHGLVLEVNNIGYDKQPMIKAEYCWRIVYEIYNIASGPYVQLQTVFLSVPKEKQGYISFGNSSLKYDWDALEAIVDNNFKNNVTIRFVDSSSNPVGVLIQYEKGINFNVTLRYWESEDLPSIVIMPYNLTGFEYNTTYDVLMQEFSIVNNGSEKVSLSEIYYDQLAYADVVISSVNVTCGDSILSISEITSARFTINNFEIPPGETRNITINFITKEKIPS